ncbi:hypothetical protein [Parasphingorhabdus halotolerans]|uniref:Terminase small subunit n=1 Tax=Parasphingorhabdus halotolerans TaxID=2725558 RepID=A0A6H2DLY8_9SPHN|nr:hypothetical protein [Parasphingorhabdus halotolerans]QJB68676.1 hypothetical protein HF685_04775 [Parasphingorhabdus halotolerans]
MSNHPTDPQNLPQHNNPEAEPPEIDAHGHNPADYDWVPVPRKRRKDGWTPEKQRRFIETLADSGVVIDAARAVGMSDTAAYKLRRAPGAEGFAAAWDAALCAASGRLADIAFDRAINGVDDVVLDREGHHVYTKRKYNDRLLMFLLRAYRPDRYRHAHRDMRALNEEPAVAATPPVAEALKRLGPAQPAEPEKLMSPDDLDVALTVADIMDGQLPHWQRQDAGGTEDEAIDTPKVQRLTTSKLQLSENAEESDEKSS